MDWIFLLASVMLLYSAILLIKGVYSIMGKDFRIKAEKIHYDNRETPFSSSNLQALGFEIEDRCDERRANLQTQIEEIKYTDLPAVETDLQNQINTRITNYELIEEIITSGSQKLVEFDSIANTYTHLIVVYYAGSDITGHAANEDILQIYFNIATSPDEYIQTRRYTSTYSTGSDDIFYESEEYINVDLSLEVQNSDPPTAGELFLPFYAANQPQFYQLTNKMFYAAQSDFRRETVEGINTPSRIIDNIRLTCVNSNFTDDSIFRLYRI